jgi:acetoin utilization protein AcuB
MNVESIMTPNAVTVSMDDTVEHVREIFHAHQFHHILVVECGRVVGVVSDRDLLKHLSPFVGTRNERAQDHWCLEKRVHQIMTRQLVSVTPETPIKVALALLIHHKVTCLPVVTAQGTCAGIVTWHDFLEYSLHCSVEPNCTIQRPEAA